MRTIRHIAFAAVLAACLSSARAHGRQDMPIIPIVDAWHASAGAFLPMDTAGARAGYALNAGYVIAGSEWQLVLRMQYGRYTIRNQATGDSRAMDHYSPTLEFHIASGSQNRVWIGPAVGLIHLRSGRSNHTDLSYSIAAGLSTGRLFAEARLIRGTGKEENGAVFALGAFSAF